MAEMTKTIAQAIVVARRKKIHEELHGIRVPPRSNIRQSDRMVPPRKKAPVKSMRLSLSQVDWDLSADLQDGNLRAIITIARAASVGGTWTRKALQIVNERMFHCVRGVTTQTHHLHPKVCVNQPPITPPQVLPVVCMILT